MLRIVRVLVATTLLAVLLPVGAASAHVRLPVNKYSCFEYISSDEVVYANRDLIIRPDQNYAFKKGTGELLGSAGEFRHPSDTNRIRFISGYLDNGWRATHSLTEGYPEVKLKRYIDGELTKIYHCSPQSG